MRSNAICPGAIETSMVIIGLPSSLEGLGGLVGDVAGLNLDADVADADETPDGESASRDSARVG
jgi:hypothetical protein